ncbi:hypothetical protein C8R44DRAFT_820159 [Mycena epipterygia]|nr:hypothetical protein C8R44DRAFT_820159 [Mycena epipterygia]
MRLPFPSRVKRKPSPASTRPTLSKASALPDVLWTAITALKESADAFPPLKSTVGGVIALLEIAERAKHSKSDAHAIALRTKEIFDVIKAAVGPAPAIPWPMRESIDHFTALLVEIRESIKEIALTGGVSRVMHLNRNERTLQDIKAKLEDAYRDFSTASALRIEAQQAHLEMQHTRIAAQQAASALRLELQQAHLERQQARIAIQQAQLTMQQTQLATQQAQTHVDIGKVSAATNTLTVQQTQLTVQQTQLTTQQTQTHVDIGKISAATNIISSDLSWVFVYFRFTVFLAGPLRFGGR